MIDTRREDMPLDVLLAFASRQNPRRGYLFVSRVLGKHIPCRPSLMRRVYERLAEPLSGFPGPMTVIGMAETATGLGAGVADSLARNSFASEMVYIHTTRYRLQAPVLVTFDENHSHAPEHILYAPQGERAELFRQSVSLVLVDDEISTGRTLKLLAKRVAVHMPKLRRIVLVSLVNWLGPSQRQALQENIHRQIEFINLLEGTFEFRPDPAYRPILPSESSFFQPSRHARMDVGRTGLIMPVDIQRLPDCSVPKEPLVIVGTGEFAFIPFLAAEELEQGGYDVLFQSTTRSPIMEGEAIQRKLMFPDEHNEGVINYIYNLPLDRRVIVAYEHPKMAATHSFVGMVDAQTWTLSCV